MKTSQFSSENQRLERIGQLLAKGLMLSETEENSDITDYSQPPSRDPIAQLFVSHRELSISDVMRLARMSRTSAHRRLRELLVTGEIMVGGKGPATRYRRSQDPKTQKA